MEVKLKKYTLAGWTEKFAHPVPTKLSLTVTTMYRSLATLVVKETV